MTIVNKNAITDDSSLLQELCPYNYNNVSWVKSKVELELRSNGLYPIFMSYLFGIWNELTMQWTHMTDFHSTNVVRFCQHTNMISHTPNPSEPKFLCATCKRLQCSIHSCTR